MIIIIFIMFIIIMFFTLLTIKSSALWVYASSDDKI